MENDNQLVETITEEASGVITIELKRPIDYNGKRYTELSFDFEKLTGKDGLNIENELQSLGKAVVVPAFSGEYLIRMAAKACGEPIGYDFLESVSMHDYNRIRNAARSFLLKSE